VNSYTALLLPAPHRVQETSPQRPKKQGAGGAGAPGQRRQWVHFCPVQLRRGPAGLGERLSSIWPESSPESSRTPSGSLYHDSELLLRVFWVSCPRNCKEFNTPVMFRVSTGKESQRDEDCTSRMGGLGSVAMGPFPTAMQEPWSTAHSSLGAPGELWTHGEQCYHLVLQMDKAKGSQMVTRAPQQRLCS
jgi:hypothetical protein